MRCFALLLLGAMVVSAPARADFFQDLGFALGKLGDKIGDTFTPDKKDPAPAQAGAAPPAPPLSITWNPVPDNALWAPAHPVLPKPKPKPPAAYQITGQQDDAPPPSAAPFIPVHTLAALAPIAGYAEAPARLPRPMPEVRLPATIAKPVVKDKPVVNATLPGIMAQPQGFALRYGNKGTQVISSSTKLTTTELQLIKAVAAQVGAPGMRLKLIAESAGAQQQNASLSRVLMVKNWLEEAGVRPTQIDLDIRSQGKQNAIELAPYRAG